PQPTPGLTTEERKLYETLCTGTDIQYLRIEQERIPIRDATTILHDQHHWPIDIPGNDIPNNNTK
ncbi:Wadjet anti-phage system protein JetD domain-containing protein, partial [Bifidobacterium adolescentis]